MADRIKIVFFDIDGTLIDMERREISEKMLWTLKRLRERRILICLATGRGPLGLPHLDGVEFDAYLTFNGSYCYDKERTIFSNPIPAEDVDTVIRNAASIHRPVSIATKDKMVANGRDKDLEDYYAFSKKEVYVSEEFEDVRKQEVYQVMLGCRREDYPHILRGTRNARIAAWWDRAADVIPANGGKGEGIRRILSYYGLDRQDALAFGDGDNDIEMLQAVGCGVAMENASKGLKEAAADVCGHVAEDGIYHYLAARKLL